MTPESGRREEPPFWDLRDVALFIGLSVPALLVAGLVVKAAWWVAGGTTRKVLEEVPAQFLAYLFLFLAVRLWFRIQYDRPFWTSLGWRASRFSWVQAATAGVVLTFAVLLVSSLIRLPDIPTPMKEWLSDRSSFVVLMIAGVTAGPLAEELIFRGLLQPVFAARIGAPAGIVLAAAGFGLMHLPQYAGSWKHGLLITAVGAAFGWMRHAARSTVASTVMHSAYNLMLFAGYLAAGKDFPKTW